MEDRRAPSAAVRPRGVVLRETWLRALDLRDPCCERGYCLLPCPNTVSCRARSNDVQLLPSVSRQVSPQRDVCQRDVCVPCFATLVAGGIRKVSHGGSDLPKVAWRVCVSAEARPPLTSVPVLTLAAATRGYIIHAQGRY